MHEKNLNALRCVKCNGKIYLDILKISSEVAEGFLTCVNCKTVFPIIHKIPIITTDFIAYIRHRISLGGKLHDLSLTPIMKEFIKNALKDRIIQKDPSYSPKDSLESYLSNGKSGSRNYGVKGQGW